MDKEIKHCYCCGKPLNDKRIMWLELNCKNGKWHNVELGQAPWPESDSQGCFPFGISCGKKWILKHEHPNTRF